MVFEPVIGLEIHAQLLTRDQDLLRRAGRRSARRRIPQCCPVCLGLPGALPVLEPARGRVADSRGARARLHDSAGRRSSRARTTSIPTCRRATRFPSTSGRSRPAGGWRSDDGRRRSACRHHARAHGGGRGQVAAPRFSGFRSRDLSRLQSQRRAAHRDRHRAGPALGRGRRGLLLAAPRDARRARRQRRQHGRGQPALRRQRVACVRRARQTFGTKAEVKNVNSFRYRAEGARVRDRAADRRPRRRRTRRSRKRGSGTARAARRRRCAARKRRTTTATFPSRICRRSSSSRRGWRRFARAAGTAGGAQGAVSSPRTD